jgi:hypothetical protein
MTPAAGPKRRTVRDVPLAATVCLVAIGALFTAVAVIYFVEPAHDLPGLIPGSEAGVARHHVKHGLATLALGLAALFAAVVSSGRRPLPAPAGSLLDRRRTDDVARAPEGPPSIDGPSPATDAVAIAAIAAALHDDDHSHHHHGQDQGHVQGEDQGRPADDQRAKSA